MISRFIEKEILKSIKPNKVIGIFGPRRSGKTTLLKILKDKLKNKKILFVHGENLDVAEIFSSQRTSILSDFVRGYDLIFIDEGQKIPNIGINLKLLCDTIDKISVVVTGSSSFNLKQKIGEPLVGRSRYFYLYPLSQLELNYTEDFLKTREKLEERLIFGGYPEVIIEKNHKEKRLILERIRDGYLLKDILELDNLKNSLFIFNLLRLIAFQTGNDISYSELASNLNSNKKTVMRYLELLEKSFVLFSLFGYSRNLRKEYTKTPRYYFWDNGIRNAVISNFNRLQIRDDVGKLWENYCISERLKKVSYKNIIANRYFWRTYDQKEVDYLEEKNGQLFAFEIKWKEDKTKTKKAFLKYYPGSKFEIINKNNYLKFIS